MSHSLPTSLDKLDMALSPGSVALWARGEAKTCLIFVHGFRGHPTRTWGECIGKIGDVAGLAAADIIFAGYQSSASAHYGMSAIYELVKAIGEDPARVSTKVGGPDRRTRYKEIVLVGHSLGGAIVRDVAMNAKKLDEEWADTLSLALFAPAHLGANILTLVSMSFGFLRFAPLVEAFFLFRYPVLSDLRAGSTYLNQLLESAKAIGRDRTTVSRFVAHAEHERVVVVNAFYLDPPSRAYPNRDHVSCCKVVDPDFVTPLTDLAGILHEV